MAATSSKTSATKKNVGFQKDDSHHQKGYHGQNDGSKCQEDDLGNQKFGIDGDGQQEDRNAAQGVQP